jgi:amino acid transporter
LAGSGFIHHETYIDYRHCFDPFHSQPYRDPKISFCQQFFCHREINSDYTFCSYSLFFIDPGNISFESSPGFHSLSNAMMMLVFAFTGFEISTINAEEVSDPRRNFPSSMLMVLLFVVIIYILVQIICIGTLPELAGSENPLADAAYQFVGPIGALVITIGAVLSMTGSLNATMLGCTRLPFGLAEQKQAPEILQFTHPKFITPWLSILISAAAILVAVLAIIICIWLLSRSTANEIIQLVIAISAGFVLYMTNRVRRTR